MTYFCDASPSKLCVVESDTGKVFFEDFKGTNNEAEYAAMILCLEKANEGDTIYADSQLVVSQLTKGWKVHSANLYPFYKKAMELYRNKKVTIEWVSRDNNEAGWLLE